MALKQEHAYKNKPYKAGINLSLKQQKPKNRKPKMPQKRKEHRNTLSPY